MLHIGDTYRKVIGDANCLIRIEDIDGPHVLGVVVDEPIEINGTTMPSSNAGEQVSDLTRDVERRVEHQRALAATARQQSRDEEQFWEHLEEGTVLHHRNIADQFYRGVAERQEDGRTGLKITALVGDWPQHVRPHRDQYGEISARSYAAQQVEGQKVIRPNPAFIFESPTYDAYSKKHDPREWAEVDLSAPDLSEDEREVARLERILREVRQATEAPGLPAQKRLGLVRLLLEG